MIFRRALGLAAIVLAMSGGPAFSQTADENRDADALAADMRLLAANPLDIEALITAGELTLKMGDNTAAAGFFGRAEKLDPLNPRIKAGYGALMVRAERPGEALRRFQEAEAKGLDPGKYAADRGLAYDLIGEQERAQRDYRLVLRAGPNDEVTRRYALSLGISGRKKEALELLDPLLKRGDRAAWRDRAFVLALAGDREGAQKIADTMMSPGLGAGLAPFFERLPMLSPADRAFAVNFGELRATPERIADARMAPTLPRLGPDPYAPKAVAVAEPPKPRLAANDGDRKRKKRRKDDELAPAVPAPKPPVEVAMNRPDYGPPRAAPTSPPSPTPAPVYVAPPPASQPVPASAPLPSPSVKAAEAPKPLVTPPPAPAPAPAPAVAPTPVPMSVPTPAPAPVRLADNAQPAPTPGFQSLSRAGVVDQPNPAEAGVSPAATARVSEDTVLAKIIAGISVPASELGVAPMPTRAAVPPPAPKPAESAPETKTKPEEGARIAPKPVEPKTAARRTSKEESADEERARNGRTAKAGSGKGESTKDVDAADDRTDCLPPAKGKSSARGRVAARGRTTEKCPSVDAKKGDEPKGETAARDRDDCLPTAKIRTGARGRAATKGKSTTRCETADSKAGRDSRDDEKAVGKDGCPPSSAKDKASGRGKSAAASRGRTSAKGKASARCETADAKDAKSKADAATKGEPARIWVQVAGGANEDTLEKAWNAVRAKAPDLFRGRQGWTTPLRATNRVLTGPFKTPEEAQDFVNKLGKAGLSGFVFTSTKGQKVDRLGGK